MASYTSLGAYSGTLRIPEFKGLNQYGDGIGLDPRFAAEARNMLTTQGYMRPIPAETTIVAPVVVTIGDGAAEYPLTNRCCAQLTACALRTRRVYPVTVVTTPTGGSFRMDGNASCAPVYNLRTLDGTVPDAGGGAGGAVG